MIGLCWMMFDHGELKVGGFEKCMLVIVFDSTQRLAFVSGSFLFSKMKI
jgi:hypothetical protein